MASRSAPHHGLSAERTTTASYETVFIPEMTRRRKTLFDPRLFTHAIGVKLRCPLGPALRSAPRWARRACVTVADATYRVVEKDTLKAASPAVFGSATAAYAQRSTLGAQRVLVVGAHEMVS